MDKVQKSFVASTSTLEYCAVKKLKAQVNCFQYESDEQIVCLNTMA
jgi:hypothetical protein